MTPYDELLWGYGSDPVDEPHYAKHGVRYNDIFNFGDIEVSRNIRFVYEGSMPDWPHAGPQAFDEDPEALQRHLDSLANNLDHAVPDPDFDGHIVLDIESWTPLWDWMPPGKKMDAWRAHVQRKYAKELAIYSQPETLIRDLHDGLALEAFVQTVRRVKRERPNATVGLYMLPPRDYQWTVWGERNGVDLVGVMQTRNDRAKLLWDEVDALYPSIYLFGAGTTQPRDESGKWREGYSLLQDNETYVRGNVREAVRCARGKPVYVVVWWRYHDSNKNPDVRYSLYNDDDLRIELTVPFEEGARGLIFWGNIKTDKIKTAAQYYQENQDYWTQRVAPILREQNEGGD